MLSLYASSTALTRAPVVRMSTESPARAALWKPGEVAPAHLTGEMAGDAGFDPLLLTALAQKPVMDLITGGFPNKVQREIILANQTPEQRRSAIEWMREAEVRHARLAMLAAVGWPLAELLNPWLSSTGGRAPSLFNGGLFDFPILPFFLLAMGGASYLEMQSAERALVIKRCPSLSQVSCIFSGQGAML